MTKEEMIKHLKLMQIGLKGAIKYLSNKHEFKEDLEIYQDQPKALDMAIKVLEQQPSDDCVSRQAVLDKAELVELEDGQTFYCISPEDVRALLPVTPAFPKGATNGDVLKTVFPYHSLILNNEEDYILFIIENSMCCKFTLDWWNEQYKGGKK